MRFYRIFVAVIIMLLGLILFSMSGCSKSTGIGDTASSKADIIKPKPVIESVNATTSGMKEKYYAILDIVVRNDGADGTVIVVGSITQAGQNAENEIPVYIIRDASQAVRLVVPLKWDGGEWTPNAKTRVP